MIGKLDHGERADVGVAVRVAVGETAQRERRQHAGEVALPHRRDLAGQRMRRLFEHRVGGIAAIGRGQRQLRRLRHRLDDAQAVEHGLAAAVVRQYGVGDRRRLAVAGAVGGDGEELIGAAGGAGEHRLRLLGADLAQPDLEVAAILRNVHGDVLDAARIVGCIPLHVEAGRTLGVVAQGGHRERGDRRIGIERIADDAAVDRRRVVEEHARLGGDGGARNRQVGTLHGVADEAALQVCGARLHRIGRRREQAVHAVTNHIARIRVDGLQQPGRDARLRIHARAHAQDEALAAAEIEIALEVGLVRGDVDVDVAQFQIAQPEAARIEIGIELGDDAHLPQSVFGRVVESHAVGQRRIGGQEARARVVQRAPRAAHADRGLRVRVLLRRLLQVLRQVQRLCADGVEFFVEQPLVAQVFEFGQAAREHVEIDEVRVLRRMAVEIGRVGKHRHRHLDLAALGVFAVLPVIVGQPGCRRIARVPGRIAVPLLHLCEETEDVGLGGVVLAALGEQDAGGERRVETDDLGIFADRRGFVLGTQQARGFQSAEPAGDPLRLVRGEHAEAARRRAIREDGSTQLLRMPGLVGDKLVARERRRRAEHIEAEGQRQRFHLADVIIGFVRQEFRRQSFGDLVEIADAAVEEALLLPVRAHRVELVAQAREIIGHPFGQTGIGQHVERHADESARSHIDGVARGQVVAVGVVRPVQARPGNIRARRPRGRRGPIGQGIAGGIHGRAVGLTADIGAEDDIGQAQAAQHVGAVAHFGRAQVEAHIGRIDIGQALQRHAVGAAVARAQLARAADADGDIGLDGALDQVTVGFGHARAIRVGDAHVVQTVRRRTQIEHRADVRRIQHLPARGFDLVYARSRELHQRPGLEACAVDVQRDPAMGVIARAALVGRYLCDRERQQVGAQRDRRAGVALAALHQDVVIPRLSARNQDLLIRRDRVAVCGIEGVAGRNVAVADIDLVGAGLGGRIQTHAQRLARSDADPVQARLAGRERGLQGTGDGEHRHLDLQRRAGSLAVVGLARRQIQTSGGIDDGALVHFVVQVRTHDDAPVAVAQRGQVRLERAGVAGMTGEIAIAVDLAQQLVAQVPGVVRGQVDGVGPMPIGGIVRVVGDGVLNLQLFAHGRVRRDDHVGHLEVGRRRRFDQNGLLRGGGVVQLLAELAHLAETARTPGPGRIGDDEDVIGALEIARRGHVQVGTVCKICIEPAAVADIAHIAVLIDIEETVLGQIHQVVPAPLVARGVATEVLDAVTHVEGLPREHRGRRRHRHHLQIGRRHQADRQCDRSDVVAFVLELEH